MKRIVVLGAGAAGTMMAHHLKKSLNTREWEITVIDQYQTHYYQPGFLFIPFGRYTPEQTMKPKERFIPSGVNFVQTAVERIELEQDRLMFADGGSLEYDILVIATGARIVPGEVEGLAGDEWMKSAFDFYTIEGATALRDRLATWEGGHMVIHIQEMPIKCPVAPLEFAFLADDFFRRRGIRDKVTLTYVTPLSGAFTKPTTSRVLGHTLEDKGIKLVPDFDTEEVEGRKLKSYGGVEIDFDILVTTPTNMGDAVIERSGIGDDLNFVPTHDTLQSKVKENIFVIGDATSLPASKAGSVAHFEAEVLTENIASYIAGQPLTEQFDGHANCFIESGNGKAFLIDFNYEIDPTEGVFPLAGIGPFKLLKETRLNHVGKHAFKSMYWNLLLKGRPFPFATSKLSLKGKKLPQEA